MSRPIIPPYTRNIKRYMAGLVCALLALMIVAALSITGMETDLDELEKDAREYHLVTAGLAGKIEGGLLAIPLALVSPAPGTSSWPDENAVTEARRAVDEVGTYVNSIRRLQRETGKSQFAQTTRRLARRYEAFYDVWQTVGAEGDPDFPALAASLRRLSDASEQLERLHMAHYEQESATLRKKRATHQRRLLTVGAILLLSGGGLLLLGFRLVDRDAATRAEVEAALAKSENSHAHAQKIARLGHWEWDIKTGGLIWSKEIYRIFGFNPDASPTYAAFLQAVHPDDREKVEEAVGKALKREKPYAIDHRIVLPGGAIRTVHEEGEVIFDAQTGEPLSMTGAVQDITAKKQAEEELVRQAQIIDQVHEAVCTSDLDGILTGWNQGARRQFGYSAEEIIGQHVSVLYPEGSKAEHDQTIVPNLNRDGVYVNEMLMRKKSGEEFYAHISRAILTDSTGEPYGRLGYIVDISDRKAAEEEIRKLNEELERRVVERTFELLKEKEKAETYLDIAGSIIVALDQLGHVVLINRKGCEVLGYSRNEIIGKNWFTTCLPKPVRHGVREIFCQTMNGEADLPERYENQVVTRSGEMRTIAWNNALVRGDVGEVVGTLSSGEDVTEQRKVEAAIRELDRRNEQILAAAGDGICGLDAEGRMTFVNPAAARMLGWGQEELIGRALYDVLHHNRADGSVYPKSECPVHASIQDGKVYQVDDETFWRKDGTSFPAEYTSTPIREDGRVTGAVVTFRDITERQQTEAELLHARKMDSLGSLAGGIAHSLNNLLLPILALTRMTMDEVADRKQPHEQLSKVVQAGERARELTARILAFSRHDKPERKYVDIHEVIENAVSLLRSTLPATITLETRLDPDAGKVFADPGQIESVLMNLVSNSVDALDGETGRIRVSLSAGGKGTKNGRPKGGGSWVTLSVTDTGPGVKDAVRERMFDPFFTTKEVGNGTGLGLSVAHGIVSRHGGEMDVESAPGKGTRVRLRLPRVEVGANN